MKKVNKHFYLSYEAIEKLEKIKSEQNINKNSELIEFLVNFYEVRYQNNDIAEKLLKKLAFVDRQTQIVTWQNSLLLNFFKVEPMEQTNFLFDYITEAKKDIEKENRKKQLEFFSRS
ncbi:hypothetical protein [Staphylococcus aureus]|uniref:hypothetical protein n=1 Tax=Staphylococcus aureus TaxID=1280 RepID=UPI00091ADD22|nr:hypothetical protein [Staphylococcus aureus]QPV65670.1 hypothetical protein I1A60_09350 [Staphylococcus aureus]UVI86653.1 hypothetical protein NW951_08815 [Staphylococcus aureus]UVJ27808.1 hypothetical protein NW963_08800 [Staphylococcus aureus]SGR31485.1 Uncharacterised protein [Staphylococcus aureus]SGT78016.1 Uncharacterised protein [Staphylococcus aureus]